ncbi:DUF2442 domain-containing protein [bacterium]|nr:MAG: DUF2442 domain-containing protein [bacterium]
METEVTYPRVREVRPLPGKRLFVTFSTGEARIYDCQPLLAEEAFRPLADEALFRQARADRDGYAVIWSDEIDLAESEIWINGQPAEQSAPPNSR